MSQLLWDIKPVIYSGVEFEFGPRRPFTMNGFTASAAAKFGFPMNSGIIEDRDWLDGDDIFVTHYSRHDAYSNYSFWIDFSAGYSWVLVSKTVFTLYAEFSYMRFSWDANDGYTQYATEYAQNQYNPWDPSLPKRKVQGTGITYTQNWLTMAPAVYFLFQVTGFLAIGFSAAWAPFVYGVCVDEHIKRYLLFEDYLSGGNSMKGSLELIFQAKEWMSFCLSTEGRVIRGSRGDSYETSTRDPSGEPYAVSTNGAGGGLRFLSVSISAKVQF
jgi:hypothetical protein